MAVEEYYVVPNDGLIRWVKVTGETLDTGTLTDLPNGVVYKASNFDAPAINPVKILALFRSTIVPFQATIEVRPVNLGVNITIGNTTYIYDKAYAYGNLSDIGIQWERTIGSETFHGGISWKNPGTGIRNWSDDTQFLWEPEGSPSLIYQSYWDDGLRVSTGTVDVNRYGKLGEIVDGTFTISNAGVYSPESGSGDLEYLGTKLLKGSFRVIRK